jgi:hypothetical protein
MGLLLILAFGWFKMGLIGLLMLDRHGRQGEGFVWGVLLGPIGILATVIIDANLDREQSDQAQSANPVEARAAQEELRSLLGKDPPPPHEVEEPWIRREREGWPEGE